MSLDHEEFLITEFKQNFEHKRHFQTQRQALIGLYFMVTLAIPVILGALTEQFYQGLLLVLFFAVGMLAFVLLIMNRKYSTTVTRQLNALRRYFVSKLQNPDIESIFPKEYLTRDFPRYLNFKSDSFVIFCLVGLVNSVAVCGGTYILSSKLWLCLIVLAISVGLHLTIMVSVLSK